MTLKKIQEIDKCDEINKMFQDFKRLSQRVKRTEYSNKK